MSKNSNYNDHHIIQSLSKFQNEALNLLISEIVLIDLKNFHEAKEAEKLI